MKKIVLFVFIFALIGSMAFALDQTAKVSFGFNYGYGNVAKAQTFQPDRNIKNSAFEFNFGYDLEFDNGLVIYDNVGLDFVTDIERKSLSDNKNDLWYTAGEWEKLENCSKFMYQEDLGIAYALHFDKIRALAGCGFHLELMTSNFKDVEEPATALFGSFGVNLLLEGAYELKDNFSVLATLKPNLNLYSFWDGNFRNDSDNDGCSDGALKFSASALVGASYKF